MSKDAPSDLSAASEALEAELARFEELANTLKKIPLNSGKNLDRAAKATAEVTDSQERVGARVGALVQAVSRVRERQEGTAASLHVRVNEIQEKTLVFGKLLERLSALGDEARAINELIGTAGPGVIDAVQTRMSGVLDTAQKLTTDAGAEDLEDISRQGEALRQQIQATKNKLSLLQKRVTPAAN
jgi:hypothetical protein